MKDPYYKLTLKLLVFFLSVIALCHFTFGYGLILVAVIGGLCALQGRSGASLVIFTFMPFITMINPIVIPRGTAFAIVSRGTSLLMTIALFLAGTRRKGTERLPLGYIFFYLLVALISSFQGWFPKISFLKLINFSAFIIGIYIGTKNINQRREDILLIRASFLAMSNILIFGSLASLAYPPVAYFTTMRSFIEDEGLGYAAELMTEYDGMGLFTGITVHSQFLGPALACFAGWIACDMLFVEKRVRWLHFLLLLPIPVMIYMTRSRTGFITFAALLLCFMFYCIPKVKISDREREKVKSIVLAFAFSIVIAATIAEIRNNTMSNLLRKKNDSQYDERTFIEAFTGSRMGKARECIRDFKLNPLWGMGFQVIPEHHAWFSQGRISYFTAPIEKGILPLMVLGETGIIGVVFFLVFLFSFYIGADRKGYAATLTLFGGLLASNLAEATFFSPAGGGGVFWMITVVGGFIVDMSLKSSCEKGQPQKLIIDDHGCIIGILESNDPKKNSGSHERGSTSGWHGILGRK